MNRSWIRTLAPLTASALLAAAVMAEPPTKSDAPAAPTNPLSGPEVKDRDVPGVDNRFGDDAQGRMRRTDRVPHRAFMGAVRTLASPNTPEDVRLTQDQMETIREISQEFQAEMQAFRAEHQEEFDEMRPPQRDRPDGEAPPRPRGERGNPPRDGDGAAPPPPRRGGPDGAAPRGRGPDAAPPAPRGEGRGPGAPNDQPRGRATPEQRERIQELMKDAPSPDPYHTRIWESLTQPQRDLLKQRIDAARADRASDGAAGRPDQPGEQDKVRQRRQRGQIEDGQQPRAPRAPRPPKQPGA